MKFAIIIDSLFSHNSIAYVCDYVGIRPIHVFSSKEYFHKHFNKVDSSIYRTCFVFEDSETFLKDIDFFKNDIIFTFACTEASQRCKDIIDNLLNLKIKNDPNFYNERYDKFCLYQRLNQPASKNNFKEFIDTYKSCIVKPYNIEETGGCVDVHYRNKYFPEDEKKNYFISQYFEGEEFCIDLSSCDGKHKLVAVWRYIRNNDEKVWKHKVLLVDYNEEKNLVDSIYQRSVRWLDSINHRHGPTHIELKINKDQFFCIEINFRLHGHMNYLTLNKTLSNTQHSLLINSFNSKDKFLELSTYKNTGFISRIYLLNNKERLSEDIKWKEIENSKSVEKVYKHIRNKGPVPISKKTSIDATALVILFNESKEELLKDEERVFSLFND